MKTITVTCMWESVHTIEVPDDWEMTDKLSDFPPEALEEMTPIAAELKDWY